MSYLIPENCVEFIFDIGWLGMSTRLMLFEC